MSQLMLQRARSAAARRRIFLAIEHLEERRLMSADIRSIDGTGNNLAHTTWGIAGVDLLRMAPASYSDGISAPAGVNRPSARVISNTLSTQTTDIPNSRHLSDFVYLFGQFIDHDIDLTPSGTSETLNVAVPTGDAYFDPNSTGTQVIDFTRSVFDPATGTSTQNLRQQPNVITSFLDGSMVYGSDATRAAALRTFVGGKLRTSSGDLLPLNTGLLPNANDAGILPDSQLFLAGDVRANENIELTAIQTLFVREHNFQAGKIAAAHPGWTDEQIYQQARSIVGAEIQSITYNEFLPALLGHSLKPYAGYNPNVNPGVSTEFSTAAYRFGHSMLDGDISRLDNEGNVIPEGNLQLQSAFFNSTLLDPTLPNHEGDIGPILKGAASGDAQEIDLKIVDDVRNFLFGPPGAGGFDLAALNIQRGRDHGLADYNTTRVAYGLPAVTSFSQITSDPVLQQKLAALYGTVNNVDLWVGGLAENHTPDSSVGPLFGKIIADQFTRLRDGDRFFFERQFAGQQLNDIEHTSLADIIRRDSSTTNVQDNVFLYETSISGHVYEDANRDGVREPKENPLAGWQVQLEDTSGATVATTTSSLSGEFTFKDLDLGTYRIREVAPSGWTQTTAMPADVHLTKAMDIGGIDFGDARNNGPTGPIQGKTPPPLPPMPVAGPNPNPPMQQAPPNNDLFGQPPMNGLDLASKDPLRR